MFAVIRDILGVELDSVVLSVASAHRLRKQHCEEVAEDCINNFTEQAKEAKAPLVVHFDGEEISLVFTVIFSLPGKILKSDLDGKAETMDRIVTTVTSPSLAKEQTLGFSSLEVASGYNTAR